MKNWIELKLIILPEETEHYLSIFDSMGINNISIEDPRDILEKETTYKWDFADINIFEYGDKKGLIKVYLNENTNVDEVILKIAKKIDEFKSYGIEISEPKIYNNLVNEEDWANNWKKYYKTIKVGNNIVINPIWEKYNEEPNDIVIKMDPGMAFGTGTHETTKMCLIALEKYVNSNLTVFDVGTGSGILSILSSKLNAKEVLAIDLDPVAVTSAKNNAKLNDVSIEVFEGNLLDIVNKKANIIVANILAEVIVILLENIENYLEPNGYFISSGIIKERFDLVTNKLQEKGFKIVEVLEDGDWVCIVSKL